MSSDRTSVTFRAHPLRMVLAAVVVLIWNAGAFAQVADPANVAKAQAYVDLSGTLFKNKDYQGALDALQKAEPLLAGDPSQSVARFNIARCLEELGRPVEAAVAYDLYLSMPDEARRQARARDALVRLTTTSVATLAVRCAAGGTRLHIGDGEGETTGCPVEVRLPAGEVRVHASAPGFKAREYRPAAVAGQRIELHVDLPPVQEALVAAPPPPMAPVSAEPPPPSVVVSGVTAPAASPAPESSRVVPYSLLGVGAASLTTGIVFHLLASSKRDEAGKQQYGAKRDSLTSDFETRRTIAYVGYGVGLVSAGVGAYLLLRTPSEPAQARTGLSGNGFWVIW